MQNETVPVPRSLLEKLVVTLHAAGGLITIGRDAEGKPLTLDNQGDATGGMVSYSLLNEDVAQICRDGSAALCALMEATPESGEGTR